MEMRELDASHIGQTIVVSYPGSGTNQQITGQLVNVSHGFDAGNWISKITVKVAEESYVLSDKRSGRWTQHLELLPAT